MKFLFRNFVPNTRRKNAVLEPDERRKQKLHPSRPTRTIYIYIYIYIAFLGRCYTSTVSKAGCKKAGFGLTCLLESAHLHDWPSIAER